MRKVMVLVRQPIDLGAIDVPGSRDRRVLVSEDPSAQPFAVVSLWIDSAEEWPVFAGCWAYEVIEHERWHDDTPSLSRWVFVRARARLGRIEFAERYAQHAELGRVHYPAICSYVQDIVQRSLTPGAPRFDGISELGYRDRVTMIEQAYDSPEGRAVMTADVDEFLDRAGSVAALGKVRTT